MDCLASPCLNVATRPRARQHHKRDVQRAVPNLCEYHTHYKNQGVRFILSPTVVILDNNPSNSVDKLSTYCEDKQSLPASQISPEQLEL